MKNVYKYFAVFLLLLSNGICLYSWEGNVSYEGSKFLITPDGSHIIWSGNQNYNILLINNIDDMKKDTAITFNSIVYPICISANSKLLAIKHDSATIKIINLDTRSVVYSITNNSLKNSSRYNSYFVNENKDLIIYSKENGKRIWINLESSKISFDTTRKFIGISDNGEYSLYLTAQDSIEIWNFRENRYIESIKLDFGLMQVPAAKISNDGNYIAYLDSTKTIQLYNRSALTLKTIDSNSVYDYVIFKFDNKNTSLVYVPMDYSYINSKSIVNYNIASNIKVLRSINYNQSDYFPWCIFPEDDFSISDDLKTISYFAYYLSWSNIDILDFQSNSIKRQQPDHHTSLIRYSDLNITKNILATSAGEIYLWNSLSGIPIRKFTNTGKPVFSPDENYLFIVQDNSTIKIDLSNYQIVDTVDIEGDTIISLYTTKNQNAILCQTNKAFNLLKYPELTVIKKFTNYFELVKPDYINENFIAISGNKIQLYSFKTGELISEKEFDSSILINRYVKEITYDMRYLAIIEKTDNKEPKYGNSFYGFIWDNEKNEKVVGDNCLIDYKLSFTPDNKYIKIKFLYYAYYPMIAYATYDLVNRKYVYTQISYIEIYTTFHDYTYNAFFKDRKHYIYGDRTGYFDFNEYKDNYISDVDEDIDDNTITQPYVFPNPASDRAMIKLIDNFTGDSLGQIIIYNVLGNRLDFEFELAEGKFIIDCSKAQAGMYYYVITGDNNTQSGTFLVSR